jgi:hypothetical protein
MTCRNQNVPVPPWDGRLPWRSPMLAPLGALWEEAPALAGGWPALTELNALARGRGVCNAAGRALVFVPPGARRARFEEGYEQRAWLRGEVETRACCWHDVLNAFAWCLFPRAKAALNARHFVSLSLSRQHGGLPRDNRDRLRDALTLLDESGVVVACADPALAGLLRGRQWKALFWQHRARLFAGMRFFLLGHGLMEKGLDPFVGMTGHGWILAVAPAVLAQPESALLAHLDAELARHLDQGDAGALRAEITPVPVLGVPGWWAANDDPEFYDDTAYFRPPHAVVA